MPKIKRVVLPVKCRSPRSGNAFAWLLVTAFTASLFWVGSVLGENLLLPHETIQDLRLGQFFSGGIRVRSPFVGISFVVPQDWRARLGQGSKVLHLDSATKPGIGIVHLLTDITPEQIEARLNEPQAFEASFVLHPTGPVTKDGDRWVGSYLFGETVGRAVALIGPARQAVVYLFIGPKTETASYERLLDHLASSTQFANVETANTLKRWYERLSGMMLTARSPVLGNNAGSPTMIEEWHLCHDGRFSHQVRPTEGEKKPPGESQSGKSGDEGYLESGAWRVEAQGSAAQLVVTPQHSLPRPLVLREDGTTTYLNDVEMAKKLSDRCL